MTTFTHQYDQFGRALERLKNVLRQEKNEFMRDSAIQRFEMTFDIGWKTARSFLENRHGIIATSPKEVIRMLYKQGVIEYMDTWISMADQRNATTHTYDEELAEKVYADLPSLLNLLESLHSALGKE